MGDKMKYYDMEYYDAAIGAIQLLDRPKLSLYFEDLPDKEVNEISFSQTLKIYLFKDAMKNLDVKTRDEVYYTIGKSIYDIIIYGEDTDEVI